ncbi:hypothetical protein JCM11491_004847 [Sporobolomyces phaffii]
MSDVVYLKSKLGVYPGFPKEGIVFLDVFPLLADPTAFETLMTHFLHHVTSVTLPKLREAQGPDAKIDSVVGLDARGFLFGPILAQRLQAGFVPVRKAGKLPGKCLTASYEKEDSFEMQEGGIKSGANVLIIDDLIATGGSASAAGELVEKCGAKVIENLFVIEIEFLKGKDALKGDTYSIIKD